MKILLLLLIINMDFSVPYKLGHERSRIVSYNPKYIVNATAFTSRTKRGDHYRTNMSLTTRHVWGDNVTMKLLYNMQANKIDFTWKTKGCGMFKHAWINNFLKAFSNVVTKCPIPAGTYKFNGVEFDTNFLPMPLPSGINIVTVMFFVTATEEPIIEASAVLKVNN